jgi:hypothetical protein
MFLLTFMNGFEDKSKLEVNIIQREYHLFFGNRFVNFLVFVFRLSVAPRREPSIVLEVCKVILLAITKFFLHKFKTTVKLSYNSSGPGILVRYNRLNLCSKMTSFLLKSVHNNRVFVNNRVRYKLVSLSSILNPNYK